MFVLHRVTRLDYNILVILIDMHLINISIKTTLVGQVTQRFRGVMFIL